MTAPKIDPRIVFLDLETTGLDPQKDLILEIGIVIVSRRLGYVPGGVFGRQISTDVTCTDPHVHDMHTRNGLLDDCRDYGYKAETAETSTILFLENHDFDPRDRIMIGGFSPGFDLSFLKTGMPRLAARLSHRTFDVSTVRDLVGRLVGAEEVQAWRESLHAPFKTAGSTHRAIPDCNAAIRELMGYAGHFDIHSMHDMMKAQKDEQNDL